jgi:predicted N-acetyltransferase YhbS
MKIRQLTADEGVELSLPIQSYAFEPSPVCDGALDKPYAKQRYYEGNITLLAEEDGVAVATGSAVPMRQNVRGTVYPMAGVAGAATHPQWRGKGYARALLTELLGRMRDAGYMMSTLQPFRPSFYQRFGYVGLLKTRTATFAPADLADLLRIELDGELACEPISAGHDTLREFTLDLLTKRHGFAVYRDSRAAQVRHADDRWLVIARVHGELVGAATYRITGHGGDLVADNLLTTGPLARALLLQLFARHIDHVARVVVSVAPGETPELWATDLTPTIGGRTSFPTSAAPMARILSLEGLTGMATGRGVVAVDIVDDPFIAGQYVLDGRTGHLVVHRGRGTEPAAATLTVPGLSGLVYGVLDPPDVVVCGFGALSPQAAKQLSALFPRCTPCLM